MHALLEKFNHNEKLTISKIKDQLLKDPIGKYLVELKEKHNF